MTFYCSTDLSKSTLYFVILVDSKCAFCRWGQSILYFAFLCVLIIPLDAEVLRVLLIFFFNLCLLRLFGRCAVYPCFPYIRVFLPWNMFTFSEIKVFFLKKQYCNRFIIGWSVGWPLGPSAAELVSQFFYVKLLN